MHKNKKIAILVPIVLICMVSFVFAADVKLKDLKISGVVFSQYSYDLTEKGADYNAFELTRTYLTFKSNLAEKIGLSLTLDSGRWSALNPNSLQVFVKTAYIDIKDVLPSSTLSIGILGLPWHSVVEGTWKHRFVSTIFADTEGKQTSSDLGIKLGGELISKYLEYYLVLANGEGYARPEANKTKDGYALVRLTPMPDTLKGLKIAAHHRAGLVNANQKRDRSMGFVSLEQDNYTVAGEYLYTIDQSSQGGTNTVGRGYSGWGFYKLFGNLSAFARYDWFDPDNNKTEDTHYRAIYGIGYDIADGIKITVDNQQVKYEGNAGQTNANVIYTHMLINF